MFCLEAMLTWVIQKKCNETCSGREEFSKFLSILFMGVKQKLFHNLAEKKREKTLPGDITPRKRIAHNGHNWGSAPCTKKRKLNTRKKGNCQFALM